MTQRILNNQCYKVYYPISSNTPINYVENNLKVKWLCRHRRPTWYLERFTNFVWLAVKILGRFMLSQYKIPYIIEHIVTKYYTRLIRYMKAYVFVYIYIVYVCTNDRRYNWVVFALYKSYKRRRQAIFMVMAIQYQYRYHVKRFKIVNHT